MQPPVKGIKHDAHRHFRIVSGGAVKEDLAKSQNRAGAGRSAAADESRSSLSLQGREKSQVRNELTALVSVLCTEGIYAMVACKSDLRHIVPATIRADAEMTQISCCFSDEHAAWTLPIPSIEEIITGAALNLEFPLTLTDNLLAKTCAIRSRQLEDIVIMFESPAEKRQFVSALSLFIMLPTKLSARVPLIESSPEDAAAVWAPSPRRSSDGDERIVIDQSPIGAFAEVGPDTKSVLSVIHESTGSADKVKNRKERRPSKKARKSRGDVTPNHRRKASDRDRGERKMTLPIATRAATRTPPTKPRNVRGREPSHRRPIKSDGAVKAPASRAATQSPRQLSHRARPMSTRSPSPYLRAQRRDYNIPPMPGVYSLDTPIGSWNGPRAAQPPRIGEARGFMVPALTCCNFCDHGERGGMLDRVTLRRVMAPVPGIAESIDPWRNSLSGSALSEKKRHAAGRSIPSTRMTASQLDTTDNLPSPRHFEPPSARFGRVMPETNKVSQISGYKSPVSYMPRGGSLSPSRMVVADPRLRLPALPQLASHGIVSPKRSASRPRRKEPLVTTVPISTDLMSYTDESTSEVRGRSSPSTTTSRSLPPRPLPSEKSGSGSETARKRTPNRNWALRAEKIDREVCSDKNSASRPPAASSESEKPKSVADHRERIGQAESNQQQLSDAQVSMRRLSDSQPQRLPSKTPADLAQLSEHSPEKSEGHVAPHSLRVKPGAAPEDSNYKVFSGNEGDFKDDEKMDPIVEEGSQSGEVPFPEASDTLEQNRLKMVATANRVSARTDCRSKATGFTAFFDRELSESTWQPDITDKENTLTLLYARQLESKPSPRQGAPLGVKEEDETFSISASQVVPRPVTNRNTSSSQLREGSVWRSDLGHKQMTPLEKLKTANLGFPTPFTAAITRRQDSSEINMMEKWSRSHL